MRKHQHLFFDLDNTLWDFEQNSRNTLLKVYGHFGLEQCFIDFKTFLSIFTKHGRCIEKCLDKNSLSLFDKQFPESLIQSIIATYNLWLPQQTILPSNTIETLEYLSEKKYDIHIISNGSYTMQVAKLENSNLIKFFSKIFTSEQFGAKKPHKSFFQHALKSTNSLKKRSLIIGDNLIADALGAKKCGIDHIYFNPQKTKHQETIMMEIADLKELKSIL